MKEKSKKESFGQRMAKLRAMKKGGKKVAKKKTVVVKPGEKSSDKAMAYMKRVGVGKK